MSSNSDFNYNREYRGRIKAAVLDWSGTTADAYVIAPAVVFVEVFKNQGVEISMLEARGSHGFAQGSTHQGANRRPDNPGTMEFNQGWRPHR